MILGAVPSSINTTVRGPSPETILSLKLPIYMAETILGMPGPWATHHSEASHHYTTKIGGLPDWPIPADAIRADLLQCGVCKTTPLSLVAQIYSPVTVNDQKIEERVLYVLGCVRPECGNNPNSWRTIRFQKCCAHLEDPKIELPSSSPELVPSIDDSQSLENFGVDADEEIDFAKLGEALSKAAMTMSDSRQLKKTKASKAVDVIGKGPLLKPCLNAKKDARSVLPCFYTYSKLEQYSGCTQEIYASYSSQSASTTNSQSEDNDEAWEPELYEYDSALGADRTYLKFKKRMDANPEQCFRYSFGGRPLTAAAGLRDPSPCACCGAIRQFELQLMPPVLYYLREAAEDVSIDSWNWLTIVVYTCSENCCVPSQMAGNEWVVAEESVVVQYED